MVEAQLKKRDDIRQQFNDFLDFVFTNGRNTKYDLGELARAGRQDQMRGSLSQIVPQARDHHVQPEAMDGALSLAVTLDQSLTRGSIGTSLENWARRGRV
ncbi:MAG: hypothetical protein ACP5N9_06500 [Candidatus Bilamarchaeum sp.]|jgi:hypothetical protein